MRIWDKCRSHLRAAVSLGCARRYRPLRLVQPIISFSFDDFPRTALAVGGDILRAAGAAGTYYVSLGRMGQDSPVGRLFAESDLSKALQEGHEVGCHTYSHDHAWMTPSDVFEASVVRNSLALQALVPGARFETLSYPMSCPSPANKRIGGKHFRGCRGGGQQPNIGHADLNHLRAVFLELARGDLDAVKRLIDMNCSAKGWLILATHDIEPEHSRFGCSPVFFAEVVQYALRSGSAILPVARALESAERTATTSGEGIGTCGS